MMTEEQPRVEPGENEEEPCVYLPGEKARMRYRVMDR